MLVAFLVVGQLKALCATRTVREATVFFVYLLQKLGLPGFEWALGSRRSE